MWVVLAICSAMGLGVYDIFKKVSLNNNAVIPVLFFSTLSASLMVVPFFLTSVYYPEKAMEWGLYIPFSGWKVQLMILLKTVIVLGSWIFAFYAIKHLPLTIVTPIRATGPLWTLLGAVLIYNEVPNYIQSAGIVLTLASFYYFSIVGKTEGINFKNNKWVGMIVAGTLLGACSGLYDKYLCQNYNRLEIQAFFTFYQLMLMTPILLLLWLPKRRKTTPFQFRWSIPLIGITLLFADFLYFKALSFPDVLISVVSTARRGGVVIAFIAGFIFFKEKNLLKKSVALTGILGGILLLYLGK